MTFIPTSTTDPTDPVGQNASASCFPPPFTIPNAVRFYLPLFLQAVSQSLTYPLVAAITSRGNGGVANLAAYAQAQTFLFLLGTIGAGLLTTGLVHARSRNGYRRYYAFNRRIIFLIAAIQCAASFPTIGQWIFGRVLGLPPPLDERAARIFFALLPAQILLLMRTPYQVALYNAHATGRANAATLGRILLTLLFSPLFIALQWTGPFWAVAAFTIPIALEVLVSRRLAKPFLARLAEVPESELPSFRSLFAFCMPLSVGGFFLSLSTFVVGAFLARTPEPTRMLAIHYLVMGLINPVSFAATRLQAVVIGFPPLNRFDNRTFRFALGTGILLGLIPQLVQHPVLSTLYFGRIQNLPLSDIPLARIALLLLALYPIVQALRGHAEGLAAWARQPPAILAGQSVFLSVLCLALMAFLAFHVPGFLMGGLALLLASLTSGATIRLAVWGASEQAARIAAERPPTEPLTP